MLNKKPAEVSNECVSCGNCEKYCPFEAIKVHNGISAVVNAEKCVGCGKCAPACPANVISITPKAGGKTSAKKRWHDYLWIATPIYFGLGFFNILFAWLGMIFFITPLLIAIFKGSKAYCVKYCDRGQLLELLGGKMGISLKNNPPRFLRSKWFRYGFLIFFLTMFSIMIYTTYLVFAGAELKEAVTLMWTFSLPWNWSSISFVPAWVAQFAFGFYGIMLTSMILGIVTMLFCKPRSWCAYCPMGTMTQGICQLKQKGLGFR